MFIEPGCQDTDLLSENDSALECWNVQLLHLFRFLLITEFVRNPTVQCSMCVFGGMYCIGFKCTPHPGIVYIVGIPHHKVVRLIANAVQGRGMAS